MTAGGPAAAIARVIRNPAGAPLLALAAVAGAAAVWNPAPPLNDDWMFRLAADRLASEGTLRLAGYGPATQVLHIAGAALWKSLTGGWPWGLYSSLWAAVAVWNLCAFVEESGGDRRTAALAGVCLALCPVAVASVPSLMMEMPYAALALLALRALARGAASADVAALSAAGAWAAAAFLVRQSAVGLPLGAAWCLWRAGRLDARRLAALWGPLSLAAAGFALWSAASADPSPGGLHVSARVVPFLMDLPASLPAVFSRLLACVPTLGLFALPLAAALPSRELLRAPAARAAGMLALLLCVLAAAWRGPLPMLGNILSRTGLGALSLPGFEAKAAGPFAWPLLWWALTAAAAAAAALLAASAARGGPSPARDTALGAALGQLLVPLLNDVFLDRYLFPALPGVAAAAALGASGLRLNGLRGWAVAALAGGLWTAGLVDHLAWNRARWRLAGEGAARSDVGACAVNGGYEWNAYWCYEPAMEELRATKPAAEIAPESWLSVTPRRAFLSFAPGLESAQVSRAGEAAYPTPLSAAGGRLYLYELNAPTPWPARPPRPRGDGRTEGR
ncbi:MAG: glycosyltransferase family 39 protein [Elusimicrobia bacterium]|nr:glycosyltransferase family 39 protein [Elusimicrobiota bacterium]